MSKSPFLFTPETPVSDAVRARNPGLFSTANSDRQNAMPGPKVTMPYVSPAPKPTMRQNRAGMNKTEAAFAAMMQEKGLPVLREPIGLRIANGVVYWPDFVRFTTAGAIICYEVKGGFIREDAAVKLKVAARQFPQMQFWLVRRAKRNEGGGWNMEYVAP